MGSSTRDLAHTSRRPTFASRSSLQSHDNQPTSCRCASVFGNFPPATTINPITPSPSHTVPPDTSQLEETRTPMPLALDTDLKLVSIPLTSNISLDCPNPQIPTIVPTLNIHIPYLPPDPNNRLYPFNAYCPTKPISSGLMQTVSKKQHLVDENFDEDFVTQGPSKLCRTAVPLLEVVKC
ncbi:UNVERIFIED_CONTAM: hypothetical protein Sradi_5081700 [Sesamum radiatum]|uniref:Uncharacterized protein n=1 Tax=Sesamum radiatum TaxID=300843 RepID=A0AAW2M127_SESRA